MTPTNHPVDLAALRKLAEAAVPVFVPGPGATPPAVVLALIRELEAAQAELEAARAVIPMIRPVHVLTKEVQDALAAYDQAANDSAKNPKGT